MGRELRTPRLKRYLKTYIVSPLVNKYHVCSIRVLWDDADDIWAKRMQLEQCLQTNGEVVAFVSCITALPVKNAPKKSSKTRKGEVSSSEGEEEINEEKVAKKNPAEYNPGISFWVVIDVAEVSLGDMEEKIIKQFVELGLTINSCKAIRGRGKGKEEKKEMAAASLFMTLKDHNCDEAINLTKASQKKAIRVAASNMGEDLAEVSLVESERCSYSPVQFVFTDKMDVSVKQEVVSAARECPDLKWKIVHNSEGCEEVPEAPDLPSSKLVQASDVVRRHMEKTGRGICGGNVFGKVPEARYTYVYMQTIEDYLLGLLSDRHIADSIATYHTPLVNLLSKHSCRLITPIKIDTNYIEVLNGYVFNIEEKKFELDPPSLDGSPRAFVKYEYNGMVPQPKLFIEGVENSFPEKRMRLHFLQKYYQLLLHGKFPQKEPKLLLVGPPDSGKTSWFCPFQGIIPSRYIVQVVRDGKFSGSMVDENTQIILMDEWSSDSLNSEDAKRFLQGGHLQLAQKHGPQKRFKYFSGMFITTNFVPDFGADDKAIRARLDIFKTKPLPSKNVRANQWLRINCMDIFHYVANELMDVPLFNQAAAGKHTMGAVYNDFDFDTATLAQKEDQVVRKVNKDVVDCIPKEVVEKAILDSKEFHGKMHEILSFETVYHDTVSACCDDEYMHKVFRIVGTNLWRTEALASFTMETDAIFERRRECDWGGPDSVFDAWLLSNNYERSWFNMDRFLELYPDWHKVRLDTYHRYIHEKDTQQDTASYSDIAPVNRTVEDYFNDHVTIQDVYNAIDFKKD